MNDLLDRHVGPETRKTYRHRIESGFVAIYLSGTAILDIGYKGGDSRAQPIVPQAIGVDLDHPGLHGHNLPFQDGSQDARSFQSLPRTYSRPTMGPVRAGPVSSRKAAS